MKSGRVITKNDGLRLLNNRPNGLVFSFESPDGAQEALEASVEKYTGKVEREEKAKIKHKSLAPERKVEAAKLAVIQREADVAKYDKKYGKGTWSRVTYKQEGGDDGYQYVVRVDGKVIMNGLSRSSAMHIKEKQVIELAKKEKLGNYA